MKTKNWQKLIFCLSLTLCVTSFLVTFLLAFSYWQEKRQTIQKAKQNAKQEAVRAAQKIDAELRQLKDSTTSLANDLTSGKLQDEQLKDRLVRIMTANPDFYGIGAAYAPYAYDPEVQLYAPYYVKRDGQLQMLQIELSYDYTQPEQEWYNRPFSEGEVWNDPEFGQASNILNIDFSVPFYQIDRKNQKKNPRGVALGTYSFEQTKNFMKSLNLGETGYGTLLSNTGKFIYHPNESIVIENQSIFDEIKIQKDQVLKRQLEKAITGETVMIDYVNINGQSSWIFYEPIPSTDWILGLVFIEDELIGNSSSLQKKLIGILLGSIAFFVLLSILVFRGYQGSPKTLWAVSTSTSAFLVAGIGLIWYLAPNQKQLEHSENEQDENAIVVSEAGLEQFLGQDKFHKFQPKAGQESPIYVPTGVFVQSLEFTNANNVFVTGYIWQKYEQGVHDTISRGFILPESAGNNLVIKKVYRRQQNDNIETIGWYFEATLRQNFDYSRYPFDDKDVWIRLWHKDFDQNVILVPDFDAYTLMIPTSLPGIEEDFVLPGWNLKESFFQYGLNDYNINFGIANYVGHKNVPELYFTILIERDFLTIFITNMLTPAIIAVLLFFIQSIVNRLSPLEAIEVTGAFLFIVILDQINLRQNILAAGLLYIDYFYFALYLLILLVAINARLCSSRLSLPAFEYKDSLIPKLLYWPNLLGFLLLVTLLVFF
ncbi:cache domain-containing protein [Coleofasciculus chthonoplastes]|uniref:cache domain-containing protein n=1 Tax=Coleofasciculus chthonoplastes TaxID=64178 RepID=UPI003303B53F